MLFKFCNITNGIDGIYHCCLEIFCLEFSGKLVDVVIINTNTDIFVRNTSVWLRIFHVAMDFLHTCSARGVRTSHRNQFREIDYSTEGRSISIAVLLVLVLLLTVVSIYELYYLLHIILQ